MRTLQSCRISRQNIIWSITYFMHEGQNIFFHLLLKSTWKLIKLISFHILPNSSHHSTLYTAKYRQHRYTKVNKQNAKGAAVLTRKPKTCYHLTLQLGCSQFLLLNTDLSMSTQNKDHVHTHQSILLLARRL